MKEIGLLAGGVVLTIATAYLVSDTIRAMVNEMFVRGTADSSADAWGD